MKLYYAPMAPNPDRVRFFLQEKGIWDQTPKTELNIIKQDHRQPAYLALSPLGHVPALELDDGTVLTESRAICTYFEAINPEPNLMGADGKERAVIDSALTPGNRNGANARPSSTAISRAASSLLRG